MKNFVCGFSNNKMHICLAAKTKNSQNITLNKIENLYYICHCCVNKCLKGTIVNQTSPSSKRKSQNCGFGPFLFVILSEYLTLHFQGKLYFH